MSCFTMADPYGLIATQEQATLETLRNGGIIT